MEAYEDLRFESEIYSKLKAAEYEAELPAPKPKRR